MFMHFYCKCELLCIVPPPKNMLHHMSTNNTYLGMNCNSFTFVLFWPFWLPRLAWDIFHCINSILYTFELLYIKASIISHHELFDMVFISASRLSSVSVLSDQLLLWSHTNPVVYIRAQLSSGQAESPRERGKSPGRRLTFQRSSRFLLYSLFLYMYIPNPSSFSLLLPFLNY